LFDIRVNHRGVEHRSTSSHAELASPEVIAASPAALHGDVEACVEKLLRVREEFGIAYFHLGSNVDAVAPIVARLAGR
jgi:hypothetical protein